MNDFKKIIVATFATIALLTAGTVSLRAQESTDSAFEADPYFILMGEADQAIAEQDWPVAAARLCDALAVKPYDDSNVLILNNLANIYACMGHDSLAVATYSRGLEIAPRMTKLLLGRGRTLLAMGKSRRAYEDFGHVIEIDSVSSEARFYHGMMSLYAGDAATAESDFNVLAATRPKARDTSIALATLYSLTGRDRDAIPYLERLIETDPSVEYYASLAGCHLALGQLTEASSVIGDGLGLFPDDPELYYYRAWLNRDRYRSDEARKDAEKAKGLGANPVKVDDLFAKPKK